MRCPGRRSYTNRAVVGLVPSSQRIRSTKVLKGIVARERGTFPAPLALGYEIHALAGRRASAKPARRAVVGGHRS